MVRTISYIVNECPVCKLHDGGLQRLHSDKEVAVSWVEGKKSKGKVFPYSLPSVGPGADPGVQAVSPQVT